MRVQPEKGVLLFGPNSKKGVLGAGQVKTKGGGYRDTHLYDLLIYICECPPPPQARHRGVFPIQLCLNSRGGYTGPPLN